MKIYFKPFQLKVVPGFPNAITPIPLPDKTIRTLTQQEILKRKQVASHLNNNFLKRK